MTLLQCCPPVVVVVVVVVVVHLVWYHHAHAGTQEKSVHITVIDIPKEEDYP